MWKAFSVSVSLQIAVSRPQGREKRIKEKRRVYLPACVLAGGLM
jgi:hypothetical protein